jgi:hypothetical protein
VRTKHIDDVRLTLFRAKGKEETVVSAKRRREVLFRFMAVADEARRMVT